jgi:hypothetical protein
MSDTVAQVTATVAGPSTLGRIIANINARAWESWINDYTIWGYDEDTRICEWAYALVELLEADLKVRGFVFEYDTHRMTRRMLYWCWGIKQAMSPPDWFSRDIPMSAPCKENSNDPHEYELFIKQFSYRHWMDLRPYWIPDFMNDEFATQFIALLELFCWRHVSTERSPKIQKERDLLDAENEDGSGDEGRSGADNGSYFKGKKEFY